MSARTATALTCLTLALTTGCGALGWPLTSGAVSCGTSRGVDVYVDGVTQPGQPTMSCTTALAEVQQAIDLGAAAGFWDASQVFSYRLEFLNARTVDQEGVPGPGGDLTGFSVGDFAVHQSSVIYFWDDPQLSVNFSTVTLVHEMLHWQVGQGDHCMWATKYAPGFDAFGPAQTASNFTDGCSHLTCSGSVCQ